LAGQRDYHIEAVIREVPTDQYSNNSHHRPRAIAANAPGLNMATLEKPPAIENKLVRRDQFNITPHGIVHKPTDAGFTPHPGDPFSGIERLGQLGSKSPNGSSFSAEDVHKMMHRLWAEYVADNPQLFNLPAANRSC